MFGNRGIYHKGWTAVTKHRTPWETGADVTPPAFDDDVWELYDTTTDWTQAHDLAEAASGQARTSSNGSGSSRRSSTTSFRSTTALSNEGSPRPPGGRR